MVVGSSGFRPAAADIASRGAEYRLAAPSISVPCDAIAPRETEFVRRLPELPIATWEKDRRERDMPPPARPSHTRTMAFHIEVRHMARRRTHFAAPCFDLPLSGADIPREPSTLYPVQHRFTLCAHGRTLCAHASTRCAFRLIRRRRAHPRAEGRSTHDANRRIPSRRQLTRDNTRLTLTLRRRPPGNNRLTYPPRHSTPSRARLTLDPSPRTSGRHERTRPLPRLTHRSQPITSCCRLITHGGCESIRPLLEPTHGSLLITQSCRDEPSGHCPHTRDASAARSMMRVAEAHTVGKRIA